KSTLKTMEGYKFNFCKTDDSDYDRKVRCQVQGLNDPKDVVTYDCSYIEVDKCSVYNPVKNDD
ncbi:MAG: hypothetical protein ACRCXZ_01695, partial [Patescibacteria group bacterium]